MCSRHSQQGLDHSLITWCSFTVRESSYYSLQKGLEESKMIPSKKKKRREEGELKMHDMTGSCKSIYEEMEPI